MKTPSIPRRWQIALGVLCVLFVGYMTIIMQQILLAVLVPILVAGVGYILWRVVRLFLLVEERLERGTGGA